MREQLRPAEVEQLPQSPEAVYRQTRIAHWDAIARQRRGGGGYGKWYHRRIQDIYRFLVGADQHVLEIGCGDGDLLSALQPRRGVGVDFSPEKIAHARTRHPHLEFFEADAHNLSVLEGPFDVVILSDTVNDLWDVQRAFEQIARLCAPHTRLILNFYSRLWEMPLRIVRRLRMATPNLEQNWLTVEDIQGMLNLAGFEVVRSSQEILWPLPFGALFDKFLVRFWPFRELALANFVIARPAAMMAHPAKVSVIIPARNEEGNIKAIFERMPRIGRATELIFVEGHSHDDTYAAIEREQAGHAETPSLLARQPGIGKADAVRFGFELASGEVLMILDADLTVVPEDLPRFYDAIVSGKGEFINGVRLVYPMESSAMRGLNFLGNKFFSLAFSWLLGQPVKDTLCGTKVLWRRDYERIVANRSYFGDFDPFGDFDLLFGAAKLSRRIIDLPIRYRQRTYGTTNISRWKHGVLLLRMVILAARRLKFV